jgi:hypothetical protein
MPLVVGKHQDSTIIRMDYINVYKQFNADRQLKLNLFKTHACNKINSSTLSSIRKLKLLHLLNDIDTSYKS